MEDFEVGTKYHIPERVLRDLICFGRKYNIKKLILFGSRARGTHSERSDIDIAVVGGDFDGFYWETKENAHSLLSIDLVEWKADVTEELKKELDKDGVIIYEKA